MRNPDVVIAGAGMIGLSMALELAGLGLTVSVLEQGQAMQEASWAAAGMLAAKDPENPAALRPLAELSLELYPDFLRRVETLSGLLVPLRTGFALQGVHHSGSELQGLDQQGLDQQSLRAMVPELVPGAYSFLRLDEQSLDPRDLCRALPLAARAAGVALYEHTRVERVEAAGDYQRVITKQGEFAGRHYVDCCGAWSQIMPGTSGSTPLVSPRKGQILAVTLPPNGPKLTCVLRTPEIYLVPRGDGRVVVGATVEEAGFDRTVTSQATSELLSAAAVLWPPIGSGSVTDCWTGLRPSTPDGLPMIDQVAPGLWIAAGHFRNGILLAPGTARVLAQRLLGEQVAIELEAFSAARFAAVETAS